MAIKDLFKTSTEKLSGQIKAIETELARRTAAYDQAESEAVAASADDGVYATAAERARQHKAEVDECRDRLDRLRKAYADRRAAEQSDYVARLNEKVELARKAYREAIGKHDGLKAEAEKRFNAEVREIDRALESAKVQLSQAETALAAAVRGRNEDEAAELSALRDEQKALRLSPDFIEWRKRRDELEAEHGKFAGLEVIAKEEGDRRDAVKRQRVINDKLKAHDSANPISARIAEIQTRIQMIERR